MLCVQVHPQFNRAHVGIPDHDSVLNKHGDSDTPLLFWQVGCRAPVASTLRACTELLTLTMQSLRAGG